MLIEDVSNEVENLAIDYVHRLGLGAFTIWLTENKSRYEQWLGRSVKSAIGGAYCYIPWENAHAILIQTSRIDLNQPRALEIVVCEEFLHMRHWLEGDRRRHSHHGHDRIAVQVAHQTGASMDEVRNCLKPLAPRPFRYIYACPTCGIEVPRRRRGTWSCARCSPDFSRQHVLVLQKVLTTTEYADGSA